MTDEKRLYFYLSEILEDPDITRPPEVVVPGLAWRERVTLLAAREKGGKSTLVGAAAAALSAGSPFVGEDVEAGTVLWVSLEEHMSEITRRFVQFGADPERIAIANSFQNPLEDIPGICLEVEPALIVWDTLGAFADAVSTRTIDPNDSSAWTRVVRWITTLTREMDTASLILHHSRKSDGKYRDSTAIGANVDVILEMFGDGGGPRKLKGVGRWLIEDMEVTLRDGQFRKHTPAEGLARAVLGFVRANPRCSWQQLRQAMQARDTEVKDARDRLLAGGQLQNAGSETHHAYVVA